MPPAASDGTRLKGRATEANFEIDLEELAKKIIEVSNRHAEERVRIEIDNQKLGESAGLPRRVEAPRDYTLRETGLGNQASIAQVPTATPWGPIMEAADELQTQGNALHDLIDRMEHRFARAMSPKPSLPATAPGEVKPAGTSTLANVLHERILMIRGARQRLESILDAVEL